MFRYCVCTCAVTCTLIIIIALVIVIATRSVIEINRFVCDRATPLIIEKLRSEGVAMHTVPHTTHDLEIN